MVAGGAMALAGCAGTPATAACAELESEPAYRGWLDDVANYHGTCDARGQDLVTVTVGTENNGGGHWGYDPAAVAITPGTTVRWEWTGRGGAHDVRSETGSIESGRPTDDAGTTFEHTFEQPGITRYYCTPHEKMGMKGGIFTALE